MKLTQSCVAWFPCGAFHPSTLLPAGRTETASVLPESGRALLKGAQGLANRLRPERLRPAFDASRKTMPQAGARIYPVLLAARLMRHPFCPGKISTHPVDHPGLLDLPCELGSPRRGAPVARPCFINPADSAVLSWSTPHARVFFPGGLLQVELPRLW